jgi:hypothetical protein
MNEHITCQHHEVISSCQKGYHKYGGLSNYYSLQFNIEIIHVSAQGVFAAHNREPEQVFSAWKL